jgi:hypothetical protein
MIPELTASLIFPVASGISVVWLFWPGSRAQRSSIWMRIWLSMGIGLGLASMVLFVSILLLGEVSRRAVWAECALLLGALCVTLRFRRSGPASPSQKEVNSWRNWNSIPELAFVALLVVQIIVFVLLTIREPHGGWDAWDFWNMRARFLFRAGPHWKDAYSNLLGSWRPNGDYPLLLPANVVRLWTYIGRETLAAPAIIAFSFGIATVGLLVSSVSVLRNRQSGAIAGLIILSSPFFVRHTADQYADVPFGFYLLAAITLLSMYEEPGEKYYGTLILVGLVAALSAWTKNEGMLLLLSVMISRCLRPKRVKTQPMRFAKEIGAFVAGASPVIAMLLYYKMALASHNDIVESQSIRTTLARLTDVSRYLVTLKGFASQAISLNSVPLVALPVCALFLRPEGGAARSESVKAPLLVLLLMFCGYVIVLVATPYDLAWHVKVTADRLLVQLWPSVIFLFLMIVAKPAMHRARDVADPELARSLCEEQRALA